MESRKALKMLCLHGYNTSREVFEYQFRQFKQAYENVMDFHILQAPHDVPEEPPKALVEKGFALPFKSWLKIGEWRTN